MPAGAPNKCGISVKCPSKRQKLRICHALFFLLEPLEKWEKKDGDTNIKMGRREDIVALPVTDVAEHRSQKGRNLSIRELSNQTYINGKQASIGSGKMTGSVRLN